MLQIRQQGHVCYGGICIIYTYVVIVVLIVFIVLIVAVIVVVIADTPTTSP